MFLKTNKRKGNIYYTIANSVRDGKKVKTVTLAYLGKIEDIAKLAEINEKVKSGNITDLFAVDAVSSLDYGDVAAFYGLSEKLSLREIINSIVFYKGGGLDVGIQTTIMAINRCIDPVSKNGIQFWYENTALSRFTGVSPEKLNSDALYRCMDSLNDDVIFIHRKENFR
jgi:hypothetical protein